jgi:hypothetical protein
MILLLYQTISFGSLYLLMANLLLTYLAIALDYDSKR